MGPTGRESGRVTAGVPVIAALTGGGGIAAGCIDEAEVVPGKGCCVEDTIRLINAMKSVVDKSANGVAPPDGTATAGVTSDDSEDTDGIVTGAETEGVGAEVDQDTVLPSDTATDTALGLVVPLTLTAATVVALVCAPNEYGPGRALE